MHAHMCAHVYAHVCAHMTDEAVEKQKGKGTLKEGKSKMTPKLNEELGHYFHEEDMQDAQFQNTYGWNLMCRHFNVDELHGPHFGFAIDAFQIEYGKTKNQPAGGGLNMTSMIKHVYANPFKPHVSTFTPFISTTFTPTFPEFTPTPDLCTFDWFLGRYSRFHWSSLI